MKKYKSLQYWQWGDLTINKGQIILVNESSNGRSLVSIEHYPEKNQIVSSKAVENMVHLEKIEEY